MSCYSCVHVHDSVLAFKRRDSAETRGIEVILVTSRRFQSTAINLKLELGLCIYTVYLNLTGHKCTFILLYKTVQFCIAMYN